MCHRVLRKETSESGSKRVRSRVDLGAERARKVSIGRSAIDSF